MATTRPSGVVPPATELEEDAAKLQLGPGFASGSRCLMNAEVLQVLQRKHEQLQQLSLTDPAAHVPQVFAQVLLYVQRVSRYPNPAAARHAREALSRHGLHEFELCVIGNLCPETMEEAKALVPSLGKRGLVDEVAFESVLTDLTSKKFE